MKKEKERYFAGCLFHDLYLKYSALAVLPREQEPSLQRKLGCVVRARGHHEGLTFLKVNSSLHEVLCYPTPHNGFYLIIEKTPMSG